MTELTAAVIYVLLIFAEGRDIEQVKFRSLEQCEKARKDLPLFYTVCIATDY